MKKLSILLVALALMLSSAGLFAVHAATPIAIESEEVLTATTLAVHFNGPVKIADGADPAGVVLKVTDIYTANWYFVSTTGLSVASDGKTVLLDYTGATYSFVGAGFGIEESSSWKLGNGKSVNLHDMYEFANTVERHSPDVPVLMMATFENNPAIVQSNSSDYSDWESGYWTQVTADKNEDANVAPDLAITGTEILSKTQLAVKYNGQIKLNADASTFCLKISDIYTANWYFANATGASIGSDGKTLILDFADSTFSFQGGNFGITEGSDWIIKDGDKVNLHDAFAFASTVDRHEANTPVLLFVAYDWAPNAVLPKGNDNNPIPSDNSWNFIATVDADNNPNGEGEDNQGGDTGNTGTNTNPGTADLIVLIAVAAAASGAGVVLSRKKHN